MEILQRFTLLIYVEKFGTNFSGGSTATAMLLVHMSHHFQRTVVLCAEEGIHNLNNIELIKYSDESHATDIILQFDSDSTIGYADFYVGQIFLKTKIPFYFTYHDNWPEMSAFEDATLSNTRIATYQAIFEKATHIFSVTEYKKKWIQQYSSNVTVIHNGLSQPVTKATSSQKEPSELIKILMTGTIDQRKYQKAIEVFDHLQMSTSPPIIIDIYGHCASSQLRDELGTYNFVRLRGFIKTVNYADYDLYLSTSLAENLSLAVVDALANHTPVVSFDIGGIREAVDDNVGVVIPAYDTAAMASAIIDIANSKKTFSFDALNLSRFDWKGGANKMLRQIRRDVLD